MGEQLGLPPEIVWRHPFPGPGLAIRIIGEVTRERLEVLREADAIARAEVTAAGLDRDIWQFPVVLLADVRSVGVQGDGRTYGHPMVLRPVTSEDAMTADWGRLPYEVLERISTRITNEVPRVLNGSLVLDITRQAARAPSRSGSEVAMPAGELAHHRSRSSWTDLPGDGGSGAQAGFSGTSQFAVLRLMLDGTCTHAFIGRPAMGSKRWAPTRPRARA